MEVKDFNIYRDPPIPPRPEQTYICPITITNTDIKLKALVLTLAQEELFGLKTCCEKWDVAFKIYAGLFTYNQMQGLDSPQANTAKSCVCNALNQLIK